MRKSSNNKLMMYWAVIEILLKFKQLWESIVGFKAAYDEFVGAVGKVQDTSVLADAKTGKITGQKNATLKGYVAHLFRMTSLLSVLATNKGDAQLKSQVDYSRDELEGMRPPELHAVAKLVATLLTTHKTALVDLGLKADDITRVDAIVSSLESVASATRNAINKRKAAGARVNPLMTAAGDILKNKLDGLVEQFNETEPIFYDEYWNSRDIVDYGIRHEEEETPPAPKAE
ncbi:MAG TPA: hypothetical protein VHO90_21195 [Bacteroidales bacterium]|nr:hypothetical protein [Bacteroidales bacterium]